MIVLKELGQIPTPESPVTCHAYVHQHLRSTSTITRRYTTPTVSPSTKKDQPLNPLSTSPNKKPKIDPRLGPIKPNNTLSLPLNLEIGLH